MNSILHLVHDDLAYAVYFGCRHVEVEFVMHLHDHLRLQVFLFEATMDAHHRHLDDVSRRTLDRCVDRIALGKGAHGGVLRGDIRQVTFATEECLGVTALTRQFFLRFYITDHARESRKIIVDQLFGFRTRAVELLRQTECGDTVDDSEIGCLGLAALVLGDLLNRQTVYLRCRGCMDILTGTESG